MARTRVFTFVPYQVKKGRKADEREAYCRVYSTGAVIFGKETLEKLGLDKQLFFKIFVDKGKRTIGLVFSDSVNKDALSDGWKAWSPSVYKKPDGSVKQLKASISIRSFLSELTEVILPSKRLPIGKYTDNDIKQEFYWFRIPYGEETPGGRKFDPNNPDD